MQAKASEDQVAILASQVQQLTDQVEAEKKNLEAQRKHWEAREIQFKVIITVLSIDSSESSC